jgi:hypothetical protein
MVAAMASDTTYESDLYAWTVKQGDALRRRAENEVDWDNVAEEIESLGRSQKKEIRSRLDVLLTHLLKWAFQPDQRCNSWRASIRDARREIELTLDDNPSLKSLPEEALPRAYAYARLKALDETGLYHLPEQCPWSIADVLDENWLP